MDKETSKTITTKQKTTKNWAKEFVQLIKDLPCKHELVHFPKHTHTYIPHRQTHTDTSPTPAIPGLGTGLQGQ